MIANVCLPDAELWTCLVNLDVAPRAEFVCLQKGNDACFTNYTEGHNTGQHY